MIRKVITYKDNFVDFYKNQDSRIKEKIGYVIDLVRFEKQVPKKFYKLLENTDGIWEVRVITTFESIRIFYDFKTKETLLYYQIGFLRKHRKLHKRR